MGLALQQRGDIVAVDFEALTFLHGDGLGLMRGLIEHGGETEELSLGGLVHDDLLLILIDGRDPHCTGDQDVRLSARVANLPDALAGSESLELDLRGQNRSLFVVEQGKQGHTSQHLWAARHRSPLKVKSGSRVEWGKAIRPEGCHKKALGNNRRE